MTVGNILKQIEENLEKMKKGGSTLIGPKLNSYVDPIQK